MTNPRIPRHFSIIAHGPDTVELRHGVWNPASFTLTDEKGSGRLARIVLALDGTHSAAEIAREEAVPRSDVEGVLDHLRQLDVLEQDGPVSSLDYYLDGMVPPLKPDQAPSPRPVLLLGDEEIVAETRRHLVVSLPDTPIWTPDDDDPGVRALRQPDRTWLLDGLERATMLERFAGWRDHLVVHASRVIDPTETRTLNRVSMELGLPWLHTAFDGPFVLVGPLFVPKRTSCYACLETRVLMNLREAASYQRYKAALAKGRVRLGHPPLEPALVGLLAANAALEVINFVLTGTGFTVGKVLATYLPTMEISVNEVLRVPGCEACGPVPERDDRELFFDVRRLLVDPATVGGSR